MFDITPKNAGGVQETAKTAKVFHDASIIISLKSCIR